MDETASTETEEDVLVSMAALDILGEGVDHWQGT